MADVLIVEDEIPLRQSMAIALRREGHRIAEAGSRREALAAFDRDLLDLVILDMRLPDGDGLTVLRDMQARQVDAAALVVTAYGSVETAVEAMRLGAQDFMQKPFSPERLVACVIKALENRRLRAELRRRGQLTHGNPAAEIIGASRAIVDVRKVIGQSTDARVVLITGETGTGKDLVARAVHAARDPDAPFVIVNCGALPPSLVESELFGHAQGAFTGAIRARRGLLAEADGGTSFFDEIGEVPLELQPRLLRFLETGEVRPVGADQSTRVDCRIVAATNRDLGREVREGRFRQDLLYRLDVLRISIPPLRERPEDIAPLVDHLLVRIATRLRRDLPELEPGAIEAMRGRPWPGNVRELEHALERAMLLTRDEPLPTELLTEALEDDPAEETAPAADDEPRKLPTLAQVERQHIVAVLDECNGDRTRAARMLAISRSTLRRKLIEYGMWRRRSDGGDPSASGSFETE